MLNINTTVAPAHNDVIVCDTGASNTYLKQMHTKYLKSPTILVHGPEAALPDNTKIRASHQGLLKIHPNLQIKGLVFPQLTNESLLSIGQLCDQNCTAIFDKYKMKIYKNKQLIIQGYRDIQDGLWKLKLPQLNMNYIIRKEKNKTELAQYLHACAFSPAISTFTTCIKKGNFITWPGIDELDFKKLLQNPEATIKGHLDQERANLQSTKVKETIESNDAFPDKENEKSNELYYCILKIGKDICYTDLTGRFPYTSSRGTNYIFVLYHYDGNTILLHPLRNREADTICTAWEETQRRIKATCTSPKHYIMDNETSNMITDTMEEHKVTFQLVPPHQHRRNAAERAIRTCKNHLLAGLATCHPDFPIREWDRLLGQCELTLNLLRNSRINPELSAWSYLFGNFDFNRTPLLPPGTKVIIHEKPQQRKSWAFHGVNAWYIGPALRHYRCLTCYIPSTHRERVTDTVEIVPHLIPIPNSSVESVLKSTAENLIRYLNTQLHLWGSKRSSVTEALEKIAVLLNRVKQEPPELKTSTTKTFEVKPTEVMTVTSEGGGETKREKNITSEQKEKITVKKDSTNLNRIIKESTPKSVKNSSPPPVKHSVVDPLQHPRHTREVMGKVIKKFPSIKHPMLLRRHHLKPRHSSYRARAAEYLAVQHMDGFPLHLHANHIYTEKGVRMRIDKLLQENRIVWGKSLSNELGRLTQGIRNIVGNGAMEFIKISEVPKGKKVAYSNMVCDYRPTKEEKYRVRLTVGGDVLDYYGNAASPAASLIETKLLINSTISDACDGARFLTLDIRDFFLQSFLKEPEYLRIHSRYFLDDIRRQYDIDNLIAPDGYVYCKIKRGMYGLKQAAKLARDQLVQHLAKHGYAPCEGTPNIWAHKERRTKFCLCVDDFGVKYYSKADALHLIDALKEAYSITIDWSGTKFCGLRLEWNYERKFVDVSMPSYISNLVKKMQHSPPRKPQHAPHKWIAKRYGRHPQLAPLEDITPTLPLEGIKFIQKVVGSLLYYGRAIDNTILPAVNELSITQAKPTEKTKEAANMLLDYLMTHPDAKIRFYGSRMQLHVESDAAYLVAHGAKSRIAGYFFLGHIVAPSIPPKNVNAPVHVECRLLKHVVTSAAEAETAGIYHNGCTALEIKRMLEALGHPQNPVRITTDNSTATAFSNGILKTKRSKSWDMRYHWLVDRVKNQDFCISWEKGSNNLADYHTKHFPPSYHQHVRPQYILKGH